MKKNINDLPDFDPAEYLSTPEEIREYLNAALEEHDPSSFVAAVGVVARAKGMAALAAEVGVTSNSMYKSLEKTGNPSFSTVFKVLDGLGIELVTKSRDQQAA
jgi:probable addiction module antidote protein